ncbi:MAG: NUDIX hydrolase [Planctomycetes bacterium]|nr:NUDIX hydrolase [Planctomycetota bacterium]
MHRRHLLHMLARYRQVFPGEASVVNRICALVETHADCFDRTCRPGHITGAAWIISPDRQRCLLTHHRKLDRWLQLGGHADGQWQVDEVALREAREESGMAAFTFVPIDGALIPLDIDVHQIPERRDSHGHLIEDAHEHHDVRFLLIAHSGQDVCVSDESHDVAWFTPDEVREHTDEESVLRMLRKTLELFG